MAEPQTETDNLLEDVRAAHAELGGGAEQPGRDAEGGVRAPDTAGTAEAGETAEQKAERVRDEAGRFAKATEKPRETLKVKDPAVEAKVQQEIAGTKPAETTTPERKPVEGLEIPPVTWKGSAKVEWGRLPAPVRSEIVAEHQRVAAMEAEIAPYRDLMESHKQLLVNEAGSMQAGMTALFTLARMSVDNPVGLIQHIAQSKGIDLRAFGSQQAAQPAVTGQPDIDSLIEQWLQQRLAPLQERFQQAAIQPAIDLLKAAKSDPKYPYFNDIEASLEHFIPLERAERQAAGKSATPAEILDGAYHRATWAHPVIRQQLLEAQTEAAKKDQAAQVAKARAASAVNLSGSPIPGAVAGAGNSGASVLDDVRAAAQELAGA